MISRRLAIHKKWSFHGNFTSKLWEPMQKAFRMPHADKLFIKILIRVPLVLLRIKRCPNQLEPIPLFQGFRKIGILAILLILGE